MRKQFRKKPHIRKNKGPGNFLAYWGVEGTYGNYYDFVKATEFARRMNIKDLLKRTKIDHGKD